MGNMGKATEFFLLNILLGIFGIVKVQNKHEKIIPAEKEHGPVKSWLWRVFVKEPRSIPK